MTTHRLRIIHLNIILETFSKDVNGRDGAEVDLLVPVFVWMWNLHPRLLKAGTRAGIHFPSPPPLLTDRKISHI